MNNIAIITQLQQVTYSKAIDRYNYLKTRFFVEYNAVANMEQKALQEQVENELANDINNNPIGEQQALVETLYNDIATIMADKLTGVKTARKNVKELYSKSKSKGMKAAAELGEQLLSEQELMNYVKASLAKMNVNTGFSIEDILNQVRSYRNKIILTRTNTSAANYIRSTKGYYREALVYKAFSQLFEQLDTIPVIPTGNLKDQFGKETVYDTYINFFNNIKNNFNIMVNEKVDVGYGIQVKSWSAPWERETIGYFNEKYGFGIGSRSDLLSQSGLKDKISDIYSWIKGVMYLEQFAIEAIGENQLGFVTGNNFYWTADLIAYFRAMNYFLAFGYHENKSLSPSVSWQIEPSQ